MRIRERLVDDLLTAVSNGSTVVAERCRATIRAYDRLRFECAVGRFSRLWRKTYWIDYNNEIVVSTRDMQYARHKFTDYVLACSTDDVIGLYRNTQLVDFFVMGQGRIESD